MSDKSHARPRRAIGLRAMAAAVALTALGTAGPASASEGYAISAGDRIAMRVVSWDTIELQLVDLAPLSGDYVVGPAGRVMVPMLGSLEAAGLTLDALAETVTVRLQDRLGLADPPGVSIEIAAFRPVYMLGDVAQPGTYPFTPGLTVQQALALAGGLEELPLAGTDRGAAAIRAAGVLKELGIEMARTRIRAARLSAEMESAEDFVAPDVGGHPDGAAAVAAAGEHERRLFQSRRDAQQRALDALDANRRVLEAEIAGLEEQLAGQDRQIALTAESVGNLESLVERGLARSPNFITMQRQLIDLENRKLDTETAVFRARQAIAELERDRVDIEAGRQLEVLRELQQAEADIERISARQATNRQLLAGAEALLFEEAGEGLVDVVYRITREGAEGQDVTTARPGTRLRPADVLEVTLEPAETGG